MIGIDCGFFTVYIFGIGKKFMGNSGLAHYVIAVSIADYLHLAVEVQAPQALNLSIVGSEHVIFIEPNDFSFLIKFKGVGVYPIGRNVVFDIEALAKALKSGKLAGAAIDVYPEEPASNGEFKSELQGLNNVILTPHIGGSTEEAQRDIADFVPKKIMDYINSGNTVDAVNFPNIRLPKQNGAHRFLHIHKNVPGIMAKINAVLAEYELNISGQYLSTDSEVGYVITDLDKEYNKDVIKALKKVENTIKFRVLY